MKVTTINPVIVNGKHESEPSKYLSADGDDYYGADGDDYYNAEGDYYDFDGKTANSAQILAFQKFANSKGYTPKLAEDGKYGAKTEAAIKVWGDAFDTLMTAAMGIGTTGIKKGTGEPTVAAQVEQAKKGKVWDKAKGWIQSDKAKDLLAKLQAAGGIRGLFGSIFGSKGGGSGLPSTDASPIDNSGGGSGGGSGSGDGSGTPPPPKGMSKGMKIGIAVGAVVVLGIIIYVATRPKTSVATPIAK